MMIFDPNYDWEWETRCKDSSWWCADCEQFFFRSSPESTALFAFADQEMAVSYQFTLNLDHVHRRFTPPGFHVPELCNHTWDVGSCKDCWEKKDHEDRDSQKWSVLKSWHEKDFMRWAGLQAWLIQTPVLARKRSLMIVLEEQGNVTHPLFDITQEEFEEFSEDIKKSEELIDLAFKGIWEMENPNPYDNFVAF